MSIFDIIKSIFAIIAIFICFYLDFRVVSELHVEFLIDNLLFLFSFFQVFFIMENLNIISARFFYKHNILNNNIQNISKEIHIDDILCFKNFKYTEDDCKCFRRIKLCALFFIPLFIFYIFKNNNQKDKIVLSLWIFFINTIFEILIDVINNIDFEKTNKKICKIKEQKHLSDIEKIQRKAFFLETKGYIKQIFNNSIKYHKNNIDIEIIYSIDSTNSKVIIKYIKENLTFDIEYIALIKNNIECDDDKLENTRILIDYIEKNYQKLTNINFCKNTYNEISGYVLSHPELCQKIKNDFINICQKQIDNNKSNKTPT